MPEKKRGANNSESFEVDFIKSFIVPTNYTFSSQFTMNNALNYKRIERKNKRR